jgi:hypothetical protein
MPIRVKKTHQKIEPCFKGKKDPGRRRGRELMVGSFFIS